MIIKKKLFNPFVAKYVDHIQLAVVFLSAFAVRFVWIINSDSYPTMDGYEYYENAVKFFSNEEVDFYWPVGYSFLLAVFIKFGLGNFFYLKLLNVFLSSLTSLIAFLISKQFVFNKKLQFFCAVFLVFYPELIFFTSLFWNETLFIFCFVLFFLLYLKEKYFFSSLVFSLTLFVKPILILFPLFLLPLNRTGKDKIKLLGMIYLVVIVFHLPWSFYVYSKTDRIALVSTNGSVNLFIGNNKYSSGHYDEDGLRNLNQFPTSVFREIVLDFWINDYQSIPLLVFKKISYLIFGMPKPWIPSIGIGTNLYSSLPRYIEDGKIAKFSELYPDDIALLKEVYEKSKIQGFYTLKRETNEFARANIANRFLFAGLVHYDLDKRLSQLSIFSYLFTVAIVLCFVFRLIVFGLRSNLIYLVPIYFLIFYSFFFGDFRFFLPAMPFVIIGNFVTKRSFSV